MDAMTQSILVGVTGRGENTDALRFALREATALGRGITLVHAVHPVMPPPPPSVLVVDESWESVGHTILEEVGDELRSLSDDAVPVSVLALHGDPGSVLGDLSAEAAMVVLQHRDLSRLHRIVTGSTVAAVAAHAHCPVVSVPPAAAAGTSGVVTVALHEDGGRREVLEAGFAAAALHHGSVRLVHAWRLTPAYEGVVVADEVWKRDVEAAIGAAAEELRAKYPDVPVEIDVRYDYPADVLTRVAADSDLLVIGRHGKRGPLPARTGSLARSVVAHAQCPVMIVPV